LERPGIGRSTARHEAGFTSFADDVREFCNVKSITRCALIAYSAGGPFGLAIASVLGDSLNGEPPLVYKAAIVSTVAPYSAPNVTKRMPLKNKAAWWMTRHAPMILRFLARREASVAIKDIVKSGREMQRENCNADLEYYLENPEVERMFLESSL